MLCWAVGIERRLSRQRDSDAPYMPVTECKSVDIKPIVGSTFSAKASFENSATDLSMIRKMKKDTVLQSQQDGNGKLMCSVKAVTKGEVLASLPVKLTNDYDKMSKVSDKKEST